MAYTLKYYFDSATNSYSVTGYENITLSDIVVILDTYNDGTNGSHPVTNIDNQAFSGCTSLKSIIIPDSVTSIGAQAFLNCSSLTSITIPDRATTIGMQAFNGCSSLTNVNIPNGVTSIGSGTFYNCSNLSSITIPDSVTSISGDAFKNCSSLTNITIPDSVTSIGSGAFNGCSSLKSATIGSGVTSIGNWDFQNCPNLKQLILFPSTPPTLGSEVIPNNVQTIYVLRESNEAYKGATNWTALSSKIVSDNLYLSFVRFNTKNKEYIYNGLSKKLTVLDDGRVKVQSAPVDDDDVVRLNELFELTQEQVDSLF